MSSESELSNNIGLVCIERQNQDEKMEFENLENFSDISDVDEDIPVSETEEPLEIEKIEEDQELEQDFIPKFDLNDISGQISFRNNRQQKYRREARDFLVERYASFNDFREHLKVNSLYCDRILFVIFTGKGISPSIKGKNHTLCF